MSKKKSKTTSFFNTLGFSLVEIMVTLGIAGAGAIGFMQLQKSNVTGQKKTEVKYDVNNLANSIGSLLLSEKNCRATFDSKGMSQSVNSFDEIKVEGASGGVKTLYKASDKRGNIEIVKFEYALEAPLMGAADSPRQYGTINVAIVYKNTSPLVNDDREYRKELPYSLRVETDTSGNFLSCYSAIDDVRVEALTKLCASVGGLFDDTIPEDDKKCQLHNFAITSSPPNINDLDPGAGNSHILLNHQNFKQEIYEKFIRPLYLYRQDPGDTYESELSEFSEFRMKSGQPTFVGVVSEDNDAINVEYFKALVNECTEAGKIGVFTPLGVRCQSLLCDNAADGTPQYLVGFGNVKPDGKVGLICRTLVAGGGEVCENGGKLTVDSSGGLLYDCCTPECSSNPEDHCAGVPYPSSNNCGVCNDGTAPDKDETFSWVDTGETRIKSGATCSETCGGGVVAIEKEQQRICNGDKQCGGAPCPTPTFQWVDAGTTSCNTEACPTAKACTSSCDCDNAGDVCRFGYCLNVPSEGACLPGEASKGDGMCRWGCESGTWGTCLVDPPACSGGSRPGNYKWCADDTMCACMNVDTLEYPVSIDLCMNAPDPGECGIVDCRTGGPYEGGGKTTGSTTLEAPVTTGSTTFTPVTTGSTTFTPVTTGSTTFTPVTTGSTTFAPVTSGVGACTPSWSPNVTASQVCSGHCITQNDGCGNARILVGTAPAMNPCFAHTEGPGVGCTLPTTTTTTTTGSSTGFGGNPPCVDDGNPMTEECLDLEAPSTTGMLSP